jgi:hypothetical protein
MGELKNKFEFKLNTPISNVYTIEDKHWESREFLIVTDDELVIFSWNTSA